MANPYNSDVSQQDKAGGKGAGPPSRDRREAKFPMKTGPFPGLPGKAQSRKRNPWPAAKRVEQHTKSEGL